MKRAARVQIVRFIALAILGWLATAPVAATESDAGIWAIFSTDGAFKSDGADSRWLYHFDMQARYFDLGSGVNQWLVRPAVGYKISGQVNGE